MDLTGILTLLLLAILSAMIPGVVNRLRARLAGRKGVSFWQHIHNVELLFKKGAVYSTATTALFRIAPSVYLACSMLVLCFVPVGDLPPLISFKGDFVVVAYLLALSRLALILGAMDTASSFEGMGASREALYGALVEPALFMILGAMAMVTGQPSLGAMAQGAAQGGTEIWIVLLLLFYLMVKVITVEAGRVPVDDPRTHLELTMIHEVMELDYCGVDLAMIRMGGWLKTGALAAIASAALAGSLPMPTLFSVALVLMVGVLIGGVESFQARNRLSRNTTWILTILSLSVIVFMTAFILL